MYIFLYLICNPCITNVASEITLNHSFVVTLSTDVNHEMELVTYFTASALKIGWFAEIPRP